MESAVARDSGVTVTAIGRGRVEDVDASRIVVRYDDGNGTGGDWVPVYRFISLPNINAPTRIPASIRNPSSRRGIGLKPDRFWPTVRPPSMGELALGRNVTVAFMSWGGYNFEDSILVSERLVKDDVFTSIHIEQFEALARDTKLGKEEITSDIPNVGEDALANLDESGIVRIGAEVKAGDILVGKVTPKGETQLSPEEKLLRAIFGEKAGDVKDTSLRVPPGVEGIVLDAKVFSRRGVEKDDRAQSIEEEEVNKLLKDQRDEIDIIKRNALAKLEELLLGKITSQTVYDHNGAEIVKAGQPITKAALEKVPLSTWRDIELEGAESLQDEVNKS